MRYRLRNTTPDVLIIMLLFVLPLMMFGEQTLGGETLLPAENLYQFEPYATYGALEDSLNVPAIPHNALLSDMVLQNLHWKSFIKDSFAAGEVPLWNPHQLGGLPFMAAGQPSTLYPLSVVYYLAPLEYAYGWFIVINLWLAGTMTYGYVRALNLRRPSALIAAITYQLCGFFIASAVFPMMIAGVAWLPLLLLMVEYIIRRRVALGQPTVVLWVVIGAFALGMNIFAGHVEITYYTILITAYYGAFRIMSMFWQAKRSPSAWRLLLTRFGWLAAMGTLGMVIGAVQFIPMFELVNTNWRASGKTFSETLGFAHPIRDIIQFVMPNFYGSPAQHTMFDLFQWERVPIDFTNPLGLRKTDTDWGIKNYVEGALYVGIFPLTLAAYSLASAWIDRRVNRPTLHSSPPYRMIYTVLGLLSLSFMFGMPTYALLYYGLPGLNQAHTPFRWVYALTLSTAVLAAFGFDALTQISSRRLKQGFAWVLTIIGGGVLLTVGVTRLLFNQLEPFFNQLLNSLARANEAFPDARSFYSHLMVQALWFAVMTVMSAVVFWVLIHSVHRLRRRTRFTEKMDFHGGRRGWWAWLRPGWVELGVMLAVMLVATDLMMATGRFNPASDPALLRYEPPAIAWLQSQDGHFRYITLDDPTQRPILQANMTWRYGLDDVRGYESIIPRQYVDYMREIYPQVQLDFNRIAPIYTTYQYAAGYEDFDYRDALTNPRLHLLNVRYVVTHLTTDLSDVEGYSLAYEDAAVRIWENANALPRAFVVASSTVNSNDLIDHTPINLSPATIVSDSGRELLIQLPNTGVDDILVVSQSYFPGWRAYTQTADGEIALSVQRVYENFISVELPDSQDESLIIRLVYSPTSFQIGFFSTAMGGLLSLFLLGVWAWRRFVIAKDIEGRALLARNSVAPVLLNLFNRGIDFVLAFVVLRILGPTDTGIYYYAVVVFVWFDIFTNFGLDVFLMREVSRNRAESVRLFLNTTTFRLILAVIGVALLVTFMGTRQMLVAEPFDQRGLIAIGLLYLGLVPGSLSKGMTSLYYAYERAEYPAAVSTVTTINKAVFTVAVLLLGYGIVGMAAVSIANNFITLAILMIAGRDMLTGINTPNERSHVDIPLIRGMARESYPLMLNHFLATIFFQIDVVILEAMRGAAIVGKYSVGYRWLLALNVIPAFFTMAIFPRMSRQAQEDRGLLRRNYVLSLKLLAGLVFPAAVLLTALAHPLTLLLGGQAFLPEGAIALQIMVWSMPIGWMNSLTQYLLIALDKQRQLTWAFIGGVGFNIITNLIFIPIYGYRAAAVTTILSEIMLMLGFGVLLRRELQVVNPIYVMWKSGMAAGVMAIAVLLGTVLHPAIGIGLGVAVYGVVWFMLRPLDDDEWAVLAPLFPLRIQRFLSNNHRLPIAS